MSTELLDKFTSLYSRNERYIFRFIASMLGNSDDAEDLLQETAKKLWKQFENYDSSKDFLPWACTVARYEVLSFWKRQKVRRKYFSEDVIELLAEDWDKRELEREAQTHALKSCVDKLELDDRDILNKRYESSLTLKDLANNLKQTPNSLYKKLQRIRRALFKCITLKLAEH